MNVLITGGAGFVGHHIIDYILKKTDWNIVSLDRLDTSGNLNRLTDLDNWEANKTRIKIVHHDLKASINHQTAKFIGPVDVILHAAASSHVDRSITDPMSFVLDNVVGTCNILEYARELGSGLKKFIYFGTDEIFGPAGPGVNYKEWDRQAPSNPYSASKSGAEDLCVAYENTYKMPVSIVHIMNIFGERQHHEKFIPLVIKNIIEGKEILVHADSTCTQPGTRFYLHACNVANAMLFLIEHAENGEKYNIVGDQEVSNLEVVETIERIIGTKANVKMVDFHSARPGHDLRYSLDGTKMKEMGWQLEIGFDDGMKRTVDWFLNNRRWITW